MLPFEYARIQDLRDEGLLSADFDTTRAIRIIRSASAKINLFTDSFFVPIVEILELDGRDSSVLSHNQSVKFIDITDIDILNERSSGRTDLNCAQVLPDKRLFGNIGVDDVHISDDGFHIEMVARAAGAINIFGRISGEKEFVFPRGSRNVKITGAFGFIEQRAKVTAKVTTAAALGDDLVLIDDSAGFEVDDVIVFTLAGGDEIQIVSRIDTSPDGLRFLGEDLLKFVVPLDTVVTSYGKVPFMIREAAIKLAILGRFPFASQAGMDAKTDGLIISETTDNYTYKLDPQGVTGFSSGSTGDAEIDKILDAFMAQTPPYVGFV